MTEDTELNPTEVPQPAAPDLASAPGTVVPLRRTVRIELTAAPEPTSWEIMARIPELGWTTFFAISREEAPTEGRALEVASALIQQGILNAHPDARIESC